MILTVGAAFADPLDDAMLADAPPVVAAPSDPVVDLGGRLHLRLDSHVAEPEPDQPLFAAPALVDLHVDVGPVPRLSACVAGRLEHDFAVQPGDTDAFGRAVEPTTLALDQLWVKGDVGRRLYWSLGQQRIRWGSGRFWNPTDVLNPTVRDVFDPDAERLGVPLVKLHLPVGATNLYAVGRVEGARPEDLLGALRAEVAVGTAEIAVTGAGGGDGHVRLGADVSAGVGPLDVHAEGVVHHGHPGPFWTGAFDPAAGVVPGPDDRTANWIPQIVAGLELAIPIAADTVYVGAEGFWNDAGYDDPGLFPWLLYEDDFVPLWNGRYYAAAYVHVPAPGPLDGAAFTASWVANLADASQVARLDATWTTLGRLSLRAYVAGHFVPGGELDLAFEVPAVEGVVDEAVSYTQPPVDLGLAATLVF